MSISLNAVPSVTVTPAPDFSALNAQVSAFKAAMNKELKARESEYLGIHDTLEDLVLELEGGTALLPSDSSVITESVLASDYLDTGYFIIAGRRFYVVPTTRANAIDVGTYTDFKLLEQGAGFEIDAIEARMDSAEARLDTNDTNISALESHANTVSAEMANAVSEMAAIRAIAENNATEIASFTTPA
ncbi:hypothetical protein [Francisella marina]|uniref:Phage tail protein n=1 Tax=Francisella marina TaxID=2249302 RepID=A0ABX5ZHQ0_9GAMM|nr:hypothetical protein [Francisella marina]QEO57552.1 hypothetical protein F0R74_06690 [Francisella marina]